MLISKKIASMFKHPGFVKIDYLIENKLETVSMFNGERLDPNFGYETKGETATGIANSIIGSVFTIPINGIGKSISVYITGLAAGNVKCACYLHSDLSLVGETEEKTIAGGVVGWQTFNFVSAPSLKANTGYVLVAWSNVAKSMYFDAGETDQQHYDSELYNSFPDPLVPTHNNYKFSIYCTYTLYKRGRYWDSMKADVGPHLKSRVGFSPSLTL